MLRYIFLFLILFSAMSCFRDTDFDQAEDVVLRPVAELNFIYFTLEEDAFNRVTLSEGNLTVSDTTEVRFLQDEFSQEGIERAEFFFQFQNSFPVGLDANFTFFSEEDVPFYDIQIEIAPGNDGEIVTSTFTQTIDQEDIEQFKESNKVVARITLNSNDGALEGVLNLQSKTTYFINY